MIRSAGCYASLRGEDETNTDKLDYQDLIPVEQAGLTLFKRFEILLLPQQGTWLRFFVNPVGIFSIQWGKTKDQRASIFVFLRAMGVSHAQIESFFNLEKLQLESFDDTLSSQKALSILGFHSKKGLGSRRAFYQRFFNYYNYRLGLIGRLRLNRRLGLSTPLKNQSISPTDIFGIFNQLAALSTGLIEQDDIDHLQNKRLRSCGDFLQESFQNALKINLKKL